MIKKFWRHITNRSVRVRMADAEFKSHQKAAARGLDTAKREAAAAEKLIKEFKKDITLWQLR